MKRNGLLCSLSLLVALSAASPLTAADFTGWARKAKITFTGYSKAGTLTNFPVLVAITNISGFSYADAAAGGGDLRFSASDGMTELAYEIDTWTSGGPSFVWVQVPALASSNDFIYAFWGKADQAIPPAYATNGATWSDGFIGVWHFNQARGILTNFTDNTANRWIATNYNNTTVGGATVSTNVNALIGTGQAFVNANKNCLASGLPDNRLAPTTTSRISFSYWCKNTSTSASDMRAVNLHRSSAWGSLINASYQVSKIRIGAYYDANLLGFDMTGGIPAAGVWHYVTVTYDGARIQSYMNDAANASVVKTLGATGDSSVVVTMGAPNPGNATAGTYLDGVLDEVRITTNALSAAWVATSFSNQVAGSRFLTYGDALLQGSSAPIILSLPVANVSGTSADMVGVYFTNGNSAATVYLFWGPVDGGTNWGGWANTNNLGSPSPGVLTNNISTLTYGSTFSYRYYATNASSDCWTLPVTFPTLGPPGFSGYSAVAGPISIALSATLSSTGAADTAVSCWFGASPSELSQVESWPATNQPQTFTRIQTGLTPGVTYYYAFKAVNTTADSHVWEVGTPTNAVTTASDYVWDGGGSGNGWSSAGNWDNDASPGSADASARLTFTTPGNVKNTADSDAASWAFQSLTFNTLAAPLTLTGGQLVPGSGGISNGNTTANRPVTISNAIQIASSLTVATPDNANAVLTLAGNLTGGGSLLISANASKGGNIPVVRLAGDNSNYTGAVTLGNNTCGLWLQRPEAMVGGTIDLSTGDRNLHVTAGSGTYTFGIGSGPGCVRFRAANDGDGLYWNGGRLAWDPGRGGDYALAGDVSVNGDVAGESFGLDFGNGNGALKVTGGNRLIRWTRGRPLGEMRIQFALGDDGSARQLNLNNGGVYRLTRPSQGHASSALYVENGATLAVGSPAHLPAGPLTFSDAWLMLDDLSWDSFLAARPLGTGNGQVNFTPGASYRLAARGTQAEIGASATFLATLARDLYLGTENRTPTNGFYDTAGVTISRDITLSGARTIWLARTGRGQDGLAAPVNRISGSIGGSGSLKIRGLEKGALSGRVGELELAGTNTWTGSPRVSLETYGFCAGPGGLIVGTDNADGGDAFVVFDGPGSQPTGNGGAAAYLATARRNYGGGDYWHGYLLKGSASGATYELPAGMRFVINRLANNVGLNAVLGSTDGSVCLAGSTVAVNSFGDDAAWQTANMALMTRGNSMLVLGTPDKPVTLMPTASASDAGLVNATPLVDRTNGVSLIKRGEGTLALVNVLYRKTDGVTDAGSQFSWQFGRAALYVDTLVNPTSDGAIRSVLDGNSANSIGSRNVRFGGAILELDASALPGETAEWTRALGTGTDQVTFDGGDINLNSLGGGWAAYSTGTVSRVVVRVTGYDTSISFWDAIKVGSQPHFFSINDSPSGPTRDPLVLGSRTANAVIDLANNLELSHRNPQIRIIDNTNSTADRAVLSGRIQTQSENKTGGLYLTGDGLLEISCSSNTHRGTFTILGPRVILTGNIAKNTSTLPAVTCTNTTAGGSFGGTGVVERDVVIGPAGTMLAMPPGSTPLEMRGATLTVTGLIGLDRDAVPAGGRWPVARATSNGVVNVSGASLAPVPGRLTPRLETHDDTLYLVFSNPGTVIAIY